MRVFGRREESPAGLHMRPPRWPEERATRRIEPATKPARSSCISSPEAAVPTRFLYISYG